MPSTRYDHPGIRSLPSQPAPANHALSQWAFRKDTDEPIAVEKFHQWYIANVDKTAPQPAEVEPPEAKPAEPAPAKQAP